MASRLKTLQGSTNPIWNQFAKGFMPNRRYIGRLVAPAVPSMTESGTLYNFGKEGFMLYDTKRALRTESQKINFAVSSETYRCVEHALETPIDYREFEAAAKYGASRILMLERRGINLVSNALEVELEKAIADIVFSGTYYATGNKVTLTGTDQWQVSGGGPGSTSDPVTDIVVTGKPAARADMGIEPNTVTFGYNSWLAFREHPSVIERFKHTSGTIITPQMVAALLGVEFVHVGESVYATDAGVWTDLWTDNVALTYTPPNPEFIEGTTPHTIVIEEEGYPEVRSYDMKKTRDFEETRKYVVKNVSTSNGYLIIDTNG